MVNDVHRDLEPPSGWQEGCILVTWRTGRLFPAVSDIAPTFHPDQAHLYQNHYPLTSHPTSQSPALAVVRMGRERFNPTKTEQNRHITSIPLLILAKLYPHPQALPYPGLVDG